MSLDQPVNTLLKIEDQTELLIDETGTLTLDDVRDRSFVPFEPLSLFINEGFKNYDISYWLKFRLSNKMMEQDLSLLFFTGQYDNIDFYTIDGRGTIDKQIGGLTTNFNKRPLSINPYYFPIRLSANEEMQVYVRINTLYRKRDITLQPQLLEPDFVENHLNQNQSIKNIYMFNAAFLGALLIMFFFTLFQYFQNRDQAYCFYSAYLLCFFFYFLHRFEIYPDVNVLFTYYADYFYGLETSLSMLSYIMYYQFARTFLSLKTMHTKLDKVLKGAIYFLFGYILLDFVVSYILADVSLGNQLYYVVRTFIIIPVSLYSFYVTIQIKDKLFRYFVGGSFFLLLGGVTAMVSSMIFETYGTHIWDRPISYFQIGVFLELLCFSLGLGYKTYQSQKEKERAQTKFISQLEQNELLQRKLNEELEKEVNIRTTEILEKSKELEKQHEDRLKAEYNQRLAEVELKALQGQMNPHFLFNSLNSIKHFILTNDKFAAADYLTNFAKLVRLILNNSKRKTISLQQELESLRLYLEMEQMRFPQKFEFEIKLAKGLNSDTIEIPPLILQPYVENAIWHGLMHKNGSGLIKIWVQESFKQLLFLIEDNGIGREKAWEIKSKSATNRKSFGMQITHDRLTLTDQNAKVKIIDLKDDAGQAKGTRVELTVPYLATV